VAVDQSRPNALHICPGKKVTPQGVGDDWGRFLVMVAEYKNSVRTQQEMEDEWYDEFNRLRKKFKDRYPKSRLKNWLKRFENAKAILELAKAGDIVLNHYAQYMQSGFANAVHSQFVNRTVDEETPCTCFVWHQNEHFWHARFDTLKLSKPAGEVSGMTPYWDSAESESGPAALAGNYPPLNRSIEFPAPVLDTLVHEMCHWCTSTEFDKCSNLLKGNERALIREGCTEWLKRLAMNDWDSGGYTDVMPRMIEIMESGVIGKEALMHAYFGGVDAQKVIDIIIECFHEKTAERSNEILEKARIADRGQVKKLMARPTYSVNRSQEFRERVSKAFSGADDSVLAAEIKNAVWLKYLRARAAGKPDAQALIIAKQ
jgi:hypothetical protein